MGCEHTFSKPSIAIIDRYMVSKEYGKRWKLPYMQADETTVIVLKDKDHSAELYKGYIWFYNNIEGCIYKYAYLSGEQVKSELDDYQGYVKSDAYAGYNILFGEDSSRLLGT